jgi:integrase
MSRPALRIPVSKKDQKALEVFLSGGVQPVRAVLRALALLQLAKGASAPRIAELISLTPQAIRKVGHRYIEGGLDRALYEKERPGAAGLLEDSQKQRIIAMVCGGPPEGYARWTVRLQPRGTAGQITVLGKGRRTRVVCLPEGTWRSLLEQKGDSPTGAPVFPSKSGRPLDRSRVLRIVREAAIRAGVNPNATTHWLRHAHASHAVERGAPIHLVQATLGHASIATTSRYLHARPGDSSARFIAGF